MDANILKSDVKRERRYESIVKMLCEGPNAIFTYNKDLMVFAAMVGYAAEKRIPLNSDVIPIALDTYGTDRKDNFIFLIALMTEKNAICLKDENLRASIRIFEEYCNGGLDLIDGWLKETTDPDGVDTLIRAILLRVEENLKLDRDANVGEPVVIKF